jgi:putative sterol carrier protein
LSIVNRQLNTQEAFLTGKMKIVGDVSRALKLGSPLT